MSCTRCGGVVPQVAINYVKSFSIWSYSSFSGQHNLGVTEAKPRELSGVDRLRESDQTNLRDSLVTNQLRFGSHEGSLDLNGRLSMVDGHTLVTGAPGFRGRAGFIKVFHCEPTPDGLNRPVDSISGNLLR